MGQGAKGRRGLKAKTTKTSWHPEELAPLKISTIATHASSLLVSICKGRNEKLQLPLNSRTIAYKKLSPHLLCSPNNAEPWLPI